jgi:cell shape-determining protein MreC
MLGGLIFLFAPQDVTNKFQFAFARIFRWPLGIGRTISLSARAQPQLTDVVSRSKYNQKLSGLRNRCPLEGAGLIFADVITSSAEGLIINRGENDGLQKGQFVLGDNSIIGTISEVSQRTAKVELITQTTSNMAVETGGLKTVMRGDGKNSAKVQLVR